jgi:hypothetical protein
VRDAALAHILMITDSRFSSNGRYFLAERSLWFSQIIDILKDNNLRMGGKKRISTKVLGRIQLNLAAIFINPVIRDILPFVGHDLKLEMNPKLL